MFEGRSFAARQNTCRELCCLLHPLGRRGSRQAPCNNLSISISNNLRISISNSHSISINIWWHVPPECGEISVLQLVSTLWFHCERTPVCKPPIQVEDNFWPFVQSVTVSPAGFSFWSWQCTEKWISHLPAKLDNREHELHVLHLASQSQRNAMSLIELQEYGIQRLCYNRSWMSYNNKLE